MNCRYTPDNHPDKAAAIKAHLAYRQLHQSACEKRRLKSLERGLLLGGIQGLTKSQTSALSDLEYHLNFLQVGPEGAVKERTLCVFRDVALVLAQEHGAHVLKETLALKGAMVEPLADHAQFECALQLGPIVISTSSPAECASAVAALRKAIAAADNPPPARRSVGANQPEKPAENSQVAAQVWVVLGISMGVLTAALGTDRCFSPAGRRFGFYAAHFDLIMVTNEV
jgi:hypothetical protein